MAVSWSWSLVMMLYFTHLSHLSLASLSLLSTKIFRNHHRALDVILKTLNKYLFLIAVDIFQLSLASLSLLGTGLAIIVFAALGCCGALASSRLLANFASIFTIINHVSDCLRHSHQPIADDTSFQKQCGGEAFFSNYVEVEISAI